MAMALVAVGFFDLTALQHERYLFQALAFLLLAAVYHRPFVLHYALASVTVFTNILCKSRRSRERQRGTGAAVCPALPVLPPAFTSSSS